MSGVGRRRLWSNSQIWIFAEPECGKKASGEEEQSARLLRWSSLTDVERHAGRRESRTIKELLSRERVGRSATSVPPKFWSPFVLLAGARPIANMRNVRPRETDHDTEDMDLMPGK
nr:hypothetical protein Iba_chr08bCG10220 [Ipomoea batatas]